MYTIYNIRISFLYGKATHSHASTTVFAMRQSLSSSANSRVLGLATPCKLLLQEPGLISVTASYIWHSLDVIGVLDNAASATSVRLPLSQQYCTRLALSHCQCSVVLSFKDYYCGANLSLTQHGQLLSTRRHCLTGTSLSTSASWF